MCQSTCDKSTRETTTADVNNYFDRKKLYEPYNAVTYKKKIKKNKNTTPKTYRNVIKLSDKRTLDALYIIYYIAEIYGIHASTFNGVYIYKI